MIVKSNVIVVERENVWFRQLYEVAAPVSDLRNEKHVGADSRNEHESYSFET